MCILIYIRGSQPGGEFLLGGISGFQGNWGNRLADSNYWNIDLSADLAVVIV